MMIKRFSNFINEEIEPKYSEKPETNAKGSVIMDDKGNPVYYLRERNPVFWEFEKNLDNFKSFKPEVREKLKTPNMSGHHKSISFGKPIFESQFLQIVLLSYEPFLKIYLNTPKKIGQGGDVLGQEQEKEIQKILNDNGLTGVKMEIINKTKGETKIQGKYNTYEQLSKVLQILLNQFGHTISSKKVMTKTPVKVG